MSQSNLHARTYTVSVSKSILKFLCTSSQHQVIILVTASTDFKNQISFSPAL